ncbi:hypothetical protein E4U13_001436, partial [Claviceps humidiphila]
LLPERNAAGTITKEGITFEKALELVEKQEQHFSERETQVTALNAHKPRSRPSRYCEHCKKPTHNTESCFHKEEHDDFGLSIWIYSIPS